MKKVSIALTDSLHEKAKLEMKKLKLNWDSYIEKLISQSEVNKEVN